MPARASSPARARTVTFMPPESPTPGGASGEECTDRTPTRRIGCGGFVSTRAPRSLPLRDRDAKHPRGCTRGCSHATGVWWLVVAATAGGGSGEPPRWSPGELLLADLGRRLLDRLGVAGGGPAGGGAGGLHRRP